jgi:anaerobic selenocysteine-containing dehydrogenase
MGTGGQGDTGMIRIDFPGYSGEGKLQEITWDEFFEKFDENGLALVYQEQTADGQQSNFNKLVSRQTAEKKGGGRGTAARRSASKSRSGGGNGSAKGKAAGGRASAGKGRGSR